MSVTPSLNAGDSGCTAPGSTPTVTQTSGGLSGRIYNNWLNDVNNGFSGSLTAGQTALLKSMCYQIALGVMQELCSEAQAGYTSLPFLNSWTNFGGVWRACAYYRDPFNHVFVIGLAAPPGGGSAANIAQLPVGYRPSASLQFLCPYFNGTSNTFTDINVDSSGNITTNGVTIISGGNVSLSPIHFLAEQ